MGRTGERSLWHDGRDIVVGYRTVATSIDCITGFTKSELNCSITSLDFLSLRRRHHSHRCLVHSVIALFCTPEPTSALSFHHDHGGYKKGDSPISNTHCFFPPGT